jgi:hypothetical protein
LFIIEWNYLINAIKNCCKLNLIVTIQRASRCVTLYLTWCSLVLLLVFCVKSLKIQKRESEAVIQRRTVSTMAKRPLLCRTLNRNRQKYTQPQNVFIWNYQRFPMEMLFKKLLFLYISLYIVELAHVLNMHYLPLAVKKAANKQSSSSVTPLDLSMKCSKYYLSKITNFLTNRNKECLYWQNMKNHVIIYNYQHKNESTSTPREFVDNIYVMYQLLSWPTLDGNNKI